MNIDTSYTPEVSAVTEKAIAQSDSNADRTWKDFMLFVVCKTAKRLPVFTTDDVWQQYEGAVDRPITHNGSALGPVMRRAAKLGYIEMTDEAKRSTRPKSHGKFLPKWKSTIFTN